MFMSINHPAEMLPISPPLLHQGGDRRGGFAKVLYIIQWK
jgi:hypothetical protein